MAKHVKTLSNYEFLASMAKEIMARDEAIALIKLNGINRVQIVREQKSRGRHASDLLGRSRNYIAIRKEIPNA